MAAIGLAKRLLFFSSSYTCFWFSSSGISTVDKYLWELYQFNQAHRFALPIS